jgi:hypothetical protein
MEFEISYYGKRDSHWVDASFLSDELKSDYLEHRERSALPFDVTMPAVAGTDPDDFNIPIESVDNGVAGQGTKRHKHDTNSTDEGVEGQEETSSFRTIQCNTEKGTKHERKLARTAGAMYFVFNCGVCFYMQELYGSEALKQVFYALKSMLLGAVAKGYKIPLAAAYDDACHLVLFLMKRQAITAAAALLTSLDWVIDRFHYDNHT